MGKYEPLGIFLRRWKSKHDMDVVELSFAEIERIIRALLPNSARTREWWRNKPGNERGFIQCRSWLEAGFEAHLLEGRERVRFLKKVYFLSPKKEPCDDAISGNTTE